MSLWDRIKSLLGFETEPDWKQNSKHYYVCPECDCIAVNARWKMRDRETDTLLFVDHRGVEHYEREMQYLCPQCREWVSIDEVYSLDEVTAFE